MYFLVHIICCYCPLNNSASWCQWREKNRPTLDFISLKMAEGELNVDSLISRLLEGEQFLHSLSCYTEFSFHVRRYCNAIYLLTTALASEKSRKCVSKSGQRQPLVAVLLRG